MPLPSALFLLLAIVFNIFTTSLFFAKVAAAEASGAGASGAEHRTAEPADFPGNNHGRADPGGDCAPDSLA